MQCGGGRGGAYMCIPPAMPGWNSDTLADSGGDAAGAAGCEDIVG